MGTLNRLHCRRATPRNSFRIGTKRLRLIRVLINASLRRPSRGAFLGRKWTPKFTTQ
jgi:hypothetical protein